MEDLIWQELKNGESDVDAEPIYKLAEYVKKININKVDKEDGKGLSSNDFTDADKEKLDGIEEGANKTTVDSELSETSTNPVQNKVVTQELSVIEKCLKTDGSNADTTFIVRTVYECPN